MQKSKNDWIQFQCKYIDDDMRHRRHNNHKSYETLRTLIKTSPRSTSIFVYSKGVPIAEYSMFLKRWTEYCNELYNHQINPDINVLNCNVNFNV